MARVKPSTTLSQMRGPSTRVTPWMDCRQQGRRGTGPAWLEWDIYYSTGENNAG